MKNSAVSYTNTPAAPHFIKSSAQCLFHEFFPSITFSPQEITQIEEITKVSRILHIGDYLYKEGEKTGSIFIVRSGSIKTYLTDSSGVIQITDFHLPGEMIGLDEIAYDSYRSNVAAMETASLCEISFQHLEQLCRNVPTLQHHLFGLMSQRINAAHNMMLTLSKKNAEEKTAIFLMDLSNRFAELKRSKRSFRLPMSRLDIGNFLGLTLETASRSLSSLQKKQIIDVDGREINIKDFEKLEEHCHKHSSA